MNQDLTQSNLNTAVKSETSNLSIARDGVTITISGPAWLIKDVYERETAPAIRIESANPEAKAIPKEWPVFKIGDRVRYMFSDRLGTIDRTDKEPRIYGVHWDDESFGEHLGVMLKNIEDEPKAEPTIEALAQQDSEAKPKRNKRKNWLLSRTPEERSAHGRMMVEAKFRKQGRTIGAKPPVPVHVGTVQDDNLVRFGNGNVNITGTVYLMSPGEQVFMPGVRAGSVYAAASGHGYKVRTKVTQKGVWVWRVK